MKHIDAGKYNKIIEILAVPNTKDIDGFNITTEKLILRTYANVKTTRGFTIFQNDGDFEKAYTNFTIRYPVEKITREMIIKFNNKKYTIDYLNNIDEENIELEIQAKMILK